MRAQSVLTRCGADEAAPFMWPKLQHVDFSYNGLTELDDSLVCCLSQLLFNVRHDLAVGVFL